MIQVAGEVVRALRAVWRRRWAAIVTAWVVGIIGVGVVWMFPNRYEASARIYVDTQTVLKPLMAGLAFQPDTDQQVRMLARTLVSRPNVERLLRRPGLNVAAPGEDHERVIDRLVDRIKVDSSGGNLYVISYRDIDPARAKTVVVGLVDLFVGSGTDSKERDSKEAGNFINDQIKTYEAKLSEAENRLKEFKIRNFAVSGASNQDYFARTSTIADEVTRLKIAYAAAEQSREALRRELASEDPQLPPDAMNAGNLPRMPSELDVRIDAQHRQLDELLRKFTDAHPDVVSARETIRHLEEQRAAAKAAAAASGGHTGAAATSPVFQKIRISLADAEANVAAIRSQLSAQQQRLSELHATASMVPQAEAELAQLNRDYDVIRKNYDMLVARREAASLGVKMDQSMQLADFRVIEPPRVTPRPVFPDRATLTMVSFLVALAAGIGLAYGLSLVYPSFSSRRALQELTRRPVVGTISTYPSTETAAAQRRDLKFVVISVVAFLVFQAAWIGWMFVRRGVVL